MDVINRGKKAGLLIGLCLIVVLSASSTSARHGGGRFGGYYHGGFGGGYHGYAGWGFYRPYWGVNFSFAAPQIGAVVSYMPEGYRAYVVNGVQYYYCDGFYFRSCPSGYVVVPEPTAVTTVAAAVTTTSQAQEPKTVSNTVAVTPASSEPAAAASKTGSDDGVTINIPNSKGGFTAVKLVKYKDGYKGPQGEYYQDHPTVDQLRALYGN
jgi:hypothetical protein